MPAYLPFEAGPHRMAMGLVSRPLSAMFEIDDRYMAEMAERRRLLAERYDEVFGALPGSEAARAETLDVVVGVLCEAHPHWFARRGDRLQNLLTGESWNLGTPERDPLEMAGLLVQEDLCIIRPEPDGPIFTAAMLCFPSRWRLHEKLGKRLRMVHEPVPFYGERLARPVDRFMMELKPGRMAERLNWGVVDDPALFQPSGKSRVAHDPAITAANAGEMLFLRVERQTLSKLPNSGCVLFTIRVHVRPLSEIAAAPAVAERLAAAIRALPPDMQIYKSVQPFRDALLTYLDKRATAAA
jgi:hypothetical protein